MTSIARRIWRLLPLSLRAGLLTRVVGSGLQAWWSAQARATLLRREARLGLVRMGFNRNREVIVVRCAGGEIAAGLAGLPFEAPTNAQRAEAALEHYEGLLRLFGERGGLRHARKHLAAYADLARPQGGAGAARDRLRLVTSEDTQEVRRLIAHLFTDHPEAEAA